VVTGCIAFWVEIISCHVFPQINIGLVVCSSDLWWKTALEINLYKLGALLYECMLGTNRMKGSVGKLLKIYVNSGLKWWKICLALNFRCFISGKRVKSTACKSQGKVLVLHYSNILGGKTFQLGHLKWVSVFILLISWEIIFSAGLFISHTQISLSVDSRNAAFIC
jgi:hypothetical protein